MKRTIFLILLVFAVSFSSFGKDVAVLEQYETKAAAMKNTVEEHRAVAKWCHENQLPDKAKYHWNQILELDTDNQEARTALDYQKDKSGWILRTDKLENRGLVRDKGEWKTRQQIEVENILAERDAGVKKWKKKITAIRKDLPSAKAEAELLDIDDPLATEPLIEAIKTEKNLQKSMTLIRAAANNPSLQTLCFIADISMNPSAPETLRNHCVDELRECLKRRSDARPVIAAIYCSYLNPGNYLPDIINEAARILGELDMDNAVPQLIDVLVTTHKFVRQESAEQNSFGSGVVGIARGSKTIRQKMDSSNQGVLSALKKLTHENYSFDQPTWRQWYQEQQRIPPEYNLRRI
ncbi:hypothetical protein FACS1894170_01220 [Planctomycetales bacterium]|nr:hypothetical protein FACS1894170_01220 [Planctomycetales bacterium]